MRHLWAGLISIIVGTLALAVGLSSYPSRILPLHASAAAAAKPLPGLAQEPVIGIRVAEVLVPVTVTDRRGEMVFDLRQNDFRIFDNEAEQDIEHFDLGGDPLSVALVAETSSRIQGLLPAIRQAGIVFAQTVMGQTAEASILSFDDSVEVVEKFTPDRDRIENAIEHLKIGTAGTMLYDAMARGIALLDEQAPVRRRVLVVVAETLDKGSDSKLGEILRRAQLANVTIYSINLSTTSASLRAEPRAGEPAPIGPPGTYPIPVPVQPQTPQLESQTRGNIDLLALGKWLVRTGKNAFGSNTLCVATKATGGLSVNTTDDRSIVKAMDSIGGEIHAQYMLGYRPPAQETSGYHTIRVEVLRPGVTVRTRPGYYLAPAGS